MGRPLPLCAVCGASLVGKAHIAVCYEGIPGKPGVGWCSGCFRREKKRVAIINDLVEDSDSPKSLAALRKLLLLIDARGKGRLVVNKQWDAGDVQVDGNV